MKKSRVILATIVGLVLLAALAVGSFLYETSWQVTVIDTAQSPQQDYTLLLQAVGEPFLFGSAPGQLVLKKGEETVSKVSIQVANDGGPIGKNDWHVAWYDEYTEVVLWGEEQFDERLILYYDGQTQRQRLTTHYGKETERIAKNTGDEKPADEPQGELFEGEAQITAGYRAIYERLSDKDINNFEVYYGAKESSSSCVLSQDEHYVEYLAYNGLSKNGKCGLYVHYRVEKRADNTWSYEDGSILNIYAFAHESGAVVSSGKTSWGEIGSEDYRKITGED